GAVASDPPRRPLRRGPHLLVSVLLAASRRARPATLALPTGGRLVRGLVAGLLARLPGPDRGRCGLAGSATLCSAAAARVLLLEAVRGRGARRGAPRRDPEPRGGL